MTDMLLLLSLSRDRPLSVHLNRRPVQEGVDCVPWLDLVVARY